MVAPFYPLYCCLYPIKSHIKSIIYGFNPYSSCLKSRFCSLVDFRGLYPVNYFDISIINPMWWNIRVMGHNLVPRSSVPVPMLSPKTDQISFSTFCWSWIGQSVPPFTKTFPTPSTRFKISVHCSHRWLVKSPQPQCGPPSQIWFITPMTTIVTSIINHTHEALKRTNLAVRRSR